MACLEGSSLWTETDRAKNMWINSKSIEKYGLTDDKTAFTALFEASTGKVLMAGNNITDIDMKKFQIGIEGLSKDLKSPGILSNKFLRAFVPGFAVSRSNPVTREFWNRLVEGNEFRANTTNKMMASYNNMMGGLKQAILEFDGMATTGDADIKTFAISADSRARKKIVNDKFNKLNEREKKYVISMKNGDKIGAAKELIGLKSFLKNEGAVFQDFLDRVEASNDSGLKYKYRNESNKKNYINRINKAAVEWRKVQDISKVHLIRSIANLNKTIELKYGHTSKTADKLISEYKEVVKNLENTEGGYIPHYVLDIMGQSIELPEMISRAKSPKDIDTALNKYVNEVKEINTSLSKRLQSRSNEDMEYFSRNPMLYANKYIEQVSSFNHSSHINHAFTAGLKKLTGVMLKNPNSPEASTAKTYAHILGSMYERASSSRKIEDADTGENLTRILTSLQFVSKLGWSTRGALRNSTQRLLNKIYWSLGAEKASNKEYNDNAIYKEGLNKQLEEKGLMFIDIAAVTEGAVSNTDLLGYGIDMEKGILTFRDKNTIMEKLAKGTSKLAEKSAILTQMAENSNRRSTFKVAYHQRYTQLQNTTEFSNIEGNPEALLKMQQSAGTYASRMTNLLHFEYSKFGKSTILGSKAGSVAGQFQHYAFSFADLQYQMLKDYSRAFKAGDYSGEEASRITKLFALYGLTEAVSVASNIDFTSYINNDTIDRVMQLKQFLTGDDEESNEAYYGKGLVGASGIVPLNDIVEIHNLGVAAGYWKMLADEGSTAAWVMGMRKYDRISNNEFVKELSGMGSIEIERILRRSFFPYFKSLFTDKPRSIFSALRAEFGLYPGTTTMGIKTHDMQKKISNSKKKPKKGSSAISKNQRAQALSALANL